MTVQKCLKKGITLFKVQTVKGKKIDLRRAPCPPDAGLPNMG